MIRLYLIRHGETNWNTEHKYQGIKDIPLNNKGKQQADAIANRMSQKNIDYIYSSDLSRAYETANMIAQKKNLNVFKKPELREIDFGEWEGYTIKELENIYGEQYKQFFLEPYKYPFPGEGSLEAVRVRIEKAIQPILQNHKNQNVAIVSHGATLKVMIMALLGMDFSYFKKFWLGNTALTIIDIKDDGKPVLALLNDQCHLDEI